MKRSFKDFLIIGGVLMAVSLFMFTFGLLVGRQVTLHDGAESPLTSMLRSLDHAPEVAQEPIAEEHHETESAAENADKGHHPPSEHAGKPPQKAESHATETHADKTHGKVAQKAAEEEAEVVEEHVEKPAKEVRASVEKELFGANSPLAQLKKPGTGKLVGKSKREVPPQVAKLFEPAEPSERKVATQTTPKAEAARLSWTLQVGSFPTLDEAKNKIATLQAKGVETAFSEESVVKGKGTWYRVSVGAFANPTDAQTAGKKLQDSGLISNFFTRKIEKR